MADHPFDVPPETEMALEQEATLQPTDNSDAEGGVELQGEIGALQMMEGTEMAPKRQRRRAPGDVSVAVSSVPNLSSTTFISSSPFISLPRLASSFLSLPLPAFPFLSLPRLALVASTYLSLPCPASPCFSLPLYTSPCLSPPLPASFPPSLSLLLPDFA